MILMNKYTKEIKYAVNGAGVGGAFCIDEARAEDCISAKRNLAKLVNDEKDAVRSSFGVLYEIGKDESPEGMKKGMGEIAGTLNFLSNIDQTFVNEGLYTDDSLGNKADELDISHDFVGNNSMEINTYNQTILEKIDGKSINEGEKSLTNAHVDESTNINKASLVDITTGATVEQHAKEIEGISKEQNFTQINKESDVSVKKIDEGSAVHEETLANINKEGGEQEQHVEANYDGIQDEQVQNINNNGLITKAELEMDADDINEDSEVVGIN